MMYNYYHFETDGQWDIGQLRELLESFGMTSDDGHDYEKQSPFISISLLMVRDRNSFNSARDISHDKTNYIPVVTSDLSDNDRYVRSILKALEESLGVPLAEEW